MDNYFDKIISRRGSYSAKWRSSEEKHDDVIPLSVADMDLPSAPKILNALNKNNQLGIYGYTLLAPNWNNIIVNWCKQQYQWEVLEEHIVFCPRIIQAIALYLQNFTQPNDNIVLLSPSYSPITQLVIDNHRNVLFSPLIEQNGYYRIDFANLEQLFKKTKVFILISPHNPTGRVWLKSELEAISQLAEKYQITVISDEIHADFIFCEHAYIPFSTVSDYAAQHSVICTSPAKTFNLAGLEIANIVIANSQLREKFVASIQAAGIHNPCYFSVPALVAAYSDCADWLHRLKTYLASNRRYVLDTFKNELPTIVATTSEGSYLLWFDYRATGLNEMALKHWFTELAKVEMSWGSGFGLGGEGFFRLNCAAPKALLEKALRRIITSKPHHLMRN